MSPGQIYTTEYRGYCRDHGWRAFRDLGKAERDKNHWRELGDRSARVQTRTVSETPWVDIERGPR